MIVLNHGTLNRMTEPENIITVLARALGYQGDEGGSDRLDFNTQGDGVYVTNGVGSHELDMDLARLQVPTRMVDAWKRNKLGDDAQLFHAGVKDADEVKWNVEDYVLALVEYKKVHPPGPYSIDFVGYSRGAVTCFKMMNKERYLVEALGWDHFRPRYRIFTIDPVPGMTGEANEHMWDDVEITNYRAMDTRTECFILLSEGERREAFTTMLPKQARLKGGIKGLCRYDTMPGKHVAMCGSSGNHKTPMYTLIKDMVACFLDNYGDLEDLRINDDWKKLNLYAKIVNGLYLIGNSGGFMNQGGFFGLAETFMAETTYAEGRRFHVPDSTATTPKKIGAVRDAAGSNRLDKLDQRSPKSLGGKMRVFVNSAHKRLCQNLLLAYSPDLNQLDQGVWNKQYKRTLRTLLTEPNVRSHKHVEKWVSRLLNDGSWPWW